MKSLLFFLLLLPAVCFGQWSESFESSKDPSYYGCWTFEEATIVDYSSSSEGWRHLVQLSTQGGFLETPYMEFSNLDQSIYFILYTTGNDGKTAALALDYISTEGTVVASFLVEEEGSVSVGVSSSPQGFTGKAKLRVSVASVDNTGGMVGVYVDGFQGFGLTLSGCKQGVLPVTLISLRAVGDQLQWATAQEKDSERFAVEHSTDGKTFREVGSVRAAGYSSGRRDYSWRFAKVGGTHYFRLRMIDSDGTYDLSKVVAVVGRDDIAFGPFTVGMGEQLVSLSVYDMTGHKLKEYLKPEAFPEISSTSPFILYLVTDQRVQSRKVACR